jgi:hypothetical protein
VQRSNSEIRIPTADRFSERRFDLIPVEFLTLDELVGQTPPPVSCRQQPEEGTTGLLTPPPPVSFGSVEGRQQPKERRTGQLTPPPPLSVRSVEGTHQPKERWPVKNRSFKPKERRAPSL